MTIYDTLMLKILDIRARIYFGETPQMEIDAILNEIAQELQVNLSNSLEYWANWKMCEDSLWKGKLEECLQEEIKLRALRDTLLHG